MKNTLAENLLRFGAKNLSESSKQKLSEQGVVADFGRYIGQEFPLLNFAGSNEEVVFFVERSNISRQTKIGDNNVLKFYIEKITPKFNTSSASRKMIPNHLQITLGNNQTKNTTPLTLQLYKNADGTANVVSAKFYAAERLKITGKSIGEPYDVDQINPMVALKALQTGANYNKIPMIVELAKVIPA